MKKQFIAKLLALALALTMLPVAVLAANTVGSAASGDGSYGPYSPYEPVAPADPTAPGESQSPAAPEVVDTIDDVKTETNADGQTVMTATIEVKDATAAVEVADKAVDALIKKAADGDIVVIVAETTGAVTVPSKKLEELVEKTGNPVPVGNSVASVEVDKDLLKLADGADLKIAPVTNGDGTISVPVMAGDKEIKPEDVVGGINVQVPIEFPASQVKGVFGVRSGMADVKLQWSIQGDGLKINLTISASIRIDR